MKTSAAAEKIPEQQSPATYDIVLRRCVDTLQNSEATDAAKAQAWSDALSQLTLFRRGLVSRTARKYNVPAEDLDSELSLLIHARLVSFRADFGVNVFTHIHSYIGHRLGEIALKLARPVHVNKKITDAKVFAVPLTGGKESDDENESGRPAFDVNSLIAPTTAPDVLCDATKIADWCLTQKRGADHLAHLLELTTAAEIADRRGVTSVGENFSHRKFLSELRKKFG